VTTQLHELFERLSELPDSIQIAVVRAILRNIDEHQLAEEIDLVNADGLGNSGDAADGHSDTIRL
jgi:hypothetical protein